MQTETPEVSLVVSIKTFNHRYLDLQMRMPAEMEPFELAARQLIKQKITRGSVQLSASLELRGAAPVRVKRNIVEGYVEAYRELAREYGISAAPDLNALFRLPGVVSFEDGNEERNATLERALIETLNRALEELARVREREAAGIVGEMEQRSQKIDASLDGIERFREGLTRLLAERLTQRIGELLKNAAPDPQRLLQEAALIAERSDISEEMQRLRAHNRQLRGMLAAEGEIGKKLDFLLQEMNREANTIVSKTSGIGDKGLEITDLGLALKAEIEKIREQAMNLE